MDARSPRDSKTIEQLGYYDPLETNQEKAIKFKQERIEYWLSVGAQPSETVRSLLKKVGIDPTPGQKKGKVDSKPGQEPVGSAAGWDK